jgi:TPP-dependent pyruvate/acetoin dehydrogenase alpha subunit
MRVAMKNLFTPDELIAFETEIAESFNNKEIRAPIHLYSGNEAQMIDIFNGIDETDWVLCSWRSHYQCLLKGVPRDRLKSDILLGKSISLCYREYRLLSSGIVTGILPIAVGIALDIKRKGGSNKVFCFMGDMTSETGIAYECVKYSQNFKLPIHFIIEDNSKSVCTDTRRSWGCEKLFFEGRSDENITYYQYDSGKYPHAGSGIRIQF